MTTDSDGTERHKIKETQKDTTISLTREGHRQHYSQIAKEGQGKNNNNNIKKKKKMIANKRDSIEK